MAPTPPSDRMWCRNHDRPASICVLDLNLQAPAPGAQPSTCDWYEREPREPPTAKRWTIAVDFDGVLHHWDGVWGGPARIEGLPIDGAIDWLNRTAPIFDIAIYSTRCEDPEACEEITAWLWNHGINKDAMAHIRCTAHKPPALIYLDDRAMRFTGANWPTETDIHEARPWWR